MDLNSIELIKETMEYSTFIPSPSISSTSSSSLSASSLTSSLSSSSTSLSEGMVNSSSEDEILGQILNNIEKQKKHRVHNFIENVIEKYSDQEFRENFRVTRSTAEEITKKFEESIFFKIKVEGGRKEVPARTQILAFLWFAGNKSSYREVANLFNVSLSTFCRHLNLILNFFCKIAEAVRNGICLCDVLKFHYIWIYFDDSKTFID